MERLPHLLLLPLALTALLSFSAAAAVPAHPVDIEFIHSSCGYTRYPALCEQSLAGYAATVRSSPRILAQAALTVTLSRARSVSTFVGRLAGGRGQAVRSPGGGAVRDCIDTVSSSVDQLRRSLKELGQVGSPGTPGFRWHLSNVQTWVSAALTDETTCLDGFADDQGVDPRLKAAIRGKIVDLAQVTSNALALINHIDPTY